MTVQLLPAAIAADEVVWTLPAAGQVLAYYRPGIGRPLLLLHSINAAPSAFEVKPFFTELDLNRPLYAPDLPGFGRSNRDDRVYSPEFYAASIIDVIRAINAGPLDVLALSTTSEFAARAALLAPDLFHSLTLISPTGFARRRGPRSPVNARVLRILRLPFLGAGLFRLVTRRFSIGFFLDKAFDDGAPSDMVDYAYASAAQPGASYAPFYFLSGHLFTPDAVGDLYLPQQLPVLVLYDQDPNISFEYLEDVARQRSNWRLVRIPGTKGLPQFQKPRLTEAAVQEFLGINP
ncbi:MAG: alpha/beta hydrolase [Congregibacter sp.]|nr:alpha/beta hydrolase [Congregibacter sp.]